jgi:hypothetical protein
MNELLGISYYLTAVTKVAAIVTATTTTTIAIHHEINFPIGIHLSGFRFGF